MLYLISAEYIEPGPLSTKERASRTIAEHVIPSLRMLVAWEKEGNITGGIPTGERGVVFVLEAPCHEEVNWRLERLPFWDLLKWHVTPLESFAKRVDQEKERIADRR